MDIPAQVSAEAARAVESEYMELQGPEMAQRYLETCKRLQGEQNEVEKAQRGELIVT